MKYTFPLFCGLLLLVGCQPSPSSPLGPAADYFPATDLLRKGVVNKYYFHYTSEDGYERSTDILYYGYRLLPDDRLEITSYDAGFAPTFRNVTVFSDTQQIVEFQQRYWRNDTLPVSIQAGILHDWIGEAITEKLKTTTDYGNGIQEAYSLRPHSRINSKNGAPKSVVFYTKRERQYTFPDKDSRGDTTIIRDTYRPDFGLYERHMEFTEGEGLIELVEQMPRKIFLQRRAAAPKRVAYINPAATIDAGTNVEPCDSNTMIYDYYNGRPQGQYTGGKRALQQIFDQQFQPEFAKDADGYLTYRFVINCQGQAGRFITEEAGLDFNRTEFSNALVQHVYGILSGLDDWQATVVNDEPLDTYAYITLKFRAGELIEILP